MSAGVGMPGLEVEAVVLKESQLRGVLDDHDPFLFGDGAGEGPEQGRLARAGPAGDEHVLAEADADFEEFLGGRRNAAEAEEIVEGIGLAANLRMVR